MSTFRIDLLPPLFTLIFIEALWYRIHSYFKNKYINPCMHACIFPYPSLDMHVLKRTTSRHLYAVHLFACYAFLPRSTKGSDHRSLDWIGDKGVRCCPSFRLCTALWGSSVGRCRVSLRLDYSGMEYRCEGQELMTKAVGSPCQISWFLLQGNWLFLMFCLAGLSHPWESFHEVFGSLFQCFRLKSINQSINERER